MRVTSVEKARFGRRFLIQLDGEPGMILEKSTLDALGVSLGADVDPEAIEARALPLEAAAARERVFTMLDARDRTQRELEMDLRRRGYSKEAAEYALAEARRRAFVDDKRLAQFTVDSAKGIKSRRALRDKLRSRGVDSDTLNEVFAGYDERDEAQAALREAQRRLSGKEATPEVCRKATEALMRKGFAYVVARAAVRAAVQTEPPDEMDSFPEEWESSP